MKEKKSEDTKKLKPGRQRYFQMFLYFGLSGPKLNFGKKNFTNLLNLLITFEFVPQVRLENTLYNLIIEERGRLISLDDFNGQLERDLKGSPYWNVYLKTSALTTSRSIARSVSKQLFKKNKKNSVDSTIQIRPLSKFQHCQRKNLFSIPNSIFYPGYFSRVTLNLLELLKTDQVKESIKETPEKYKTLIDRINNLDEIK